MKVVVLNIPNQTERLEGFQEAYPSGMPEYEVYAAKTGDDFTPPAWWEGDADMWAQLENFRDILGSAPNEPLLVCEDDCAFDQNFVVKMNDVIEHVPNDWDIILLGGWNHRLNNAFPIKVNDYVLKCRCTNGTFCILFNPNSIQKVLDVWGTERWPCRHVNDERLALAQWTGELKVYAPLRFIAGQRGGVTSNFGGYTFSQTTFFNDFRYWDSENNVFIPAGALYNAEEEEE